jgi:heme-degrading monooxygenase HmoA
VLRTNGSNPVGSDDIELLTQPPPADAIAAMSAVAGVRMQPAMLTVQRGPEGHRGPEAAGAVLVLQVTFADETGAAGFWKAATTLVEQLANAPGFIRRYSFADGPHVTLIALWRHRADADAFFASELHQAAMRSLYEGRWQYSHFAGLWESTARRERVIFCRRCDAVTAIAERVCRGCGIDLVDPFDPCPTV